MSRFELEVEARCYLALSRLDPKHSQDYLHKAGSCAFEAGIAAYPDAFVSPLM